MIGGRVPVEVVPNGVDLERFRPARNNERQKLRNSLGMGDSDQVIVTVGAVHPRKGIDLLLKAWRKTADCHPRARLFIVGSRQDKINPELKTYSSMLESLINNSGAADRVHFTGSVENVEEYLRVADVFVFTSKKEGMGNVVLEAMASGLPVLLTPFIGLPKDFGVPGDHYLLADRDADHLSAGISRILNNNALRSALSKNSRQLMEQDMGMDSILDRYASLYHKLACHL
jgi:UDP-glucose:(heptosyl)LPS alpha-1,3-glucosyltransferase